MKFLIITEGFVAFVFCCLLAIFLLFTSFDKKAGKLLVALSLCIGFWCFAPFLINIIDNIQTALVTQRLGYFFGILIIPIFFEFILAITETNRRELKILCYTITFILFFMLITPLFIPELTIQQGLRQSKPFIFYHVFVIAFLFFVFESFYILFISIKKFTGIKQKQLKLVLYAYGIEYIGGIFYFSTIYKIIPIWTQAGYLIAIGTGILVYAVLQYRFLDLEVEMEKKMFNFKVEHTNQILNISKYLIEIKDIEALAKNATHLLGRLVDIEFACFYVKEQDVFKFKYYIRNDDKIKEIENNTLIKLLNERREPIEITQLEHWARQIKTKDLQDAYIFMRKHLKAKLIFPLVFGEVIGFFVLGLKRNDKEYNLQDINNISLLCYTTSITLYNIQLNHRVITDSLTSLYTRDYFNKQLKIKFAQAQFDKQSVIITMLDIDHFKKINDTYGHPAGNDILQEVSQAMRDCLRPQDILARWGGEEFVIIMKDVSLENANIVINRLKGYIQNNIKIEDKSITISAGLVEYQTDKEKIKDIPSLLKKYTKRMDDAMYMAKKNGRNCVSIYHQNKEQEVI